MKSLVSLQTPKCKHSRLIETEIRWHTTRVIDERLNIIYGPSCLLVYSTTKMTLSKLTNWYKSPKTTINRVIIFDINRYWETIKLYEI